MKTKELAKIQKIRDKSQAIGVFLDWLHNEKEITFMIPRDNLTDLAVLGRRGYMMCFQKTEELLAEYFNIDEDKAEKERQEIIDDIRKKAE